MAKRSSKAESDYFVSAGQGAHQDASGNWVTISPELTAKIFPPILAAAAEAERRINAFVAVHGDATTSHSRENLAVNRIGCARVREAMETLTKRLCYGWAHEATPGEPVQVWLVGLTPEQNLVLFSLWQISVGLKECMTGKFPARGRLPELPRNLFERWRRCLASARAFGEPNPAEALKGMAAASDCDAADREDEPAANDSWSSPQGPAEWGRTFKVTATTFVRWFKKKPQPIRIRRLTAKSYQVHVDDVPKTLQR